MFKQHVKVNLASDDPFNKCHITIFDKIKSINLCKSLRFLVFFYLFTSKSTIFFNVKYANFMLHLIFILLQ